MAISNLTPVEEWPTRKLPQDRFDDAVKTAMDQMSVMVGELNSAFIPQTNETIDTINDFSPNLPAILDAPNQAAAAAASAQKATQSSTKAAQSATEAAASASSASASKTAAAQSATTAKDEADSAVQSASSAASSKTAAAQSSTKAAQSATEAAASASSASASKTAAAQSAATAKDEADRAKEEADRAASVVAVDVASNTKAGIVKTDSKTLFVTDLYGTLTAEDVAIDGVLTDTARRRGQIGKCYSISSSGVDFNTLTKAGRYWFNNAAVIASTNKPPTNSGGFCDVFGEESNEKYTKQIYHVFSSPVIYIRENLGVTYGGWSKSWTKIITENSIATTEKAGLVKPDGQTTEIGSDGTLSVPKFAGSSAGLVPVATSADAKKVLLGNGTWEYTEDATASMTISADLHLTADSPRALVLTAAASGLSVYLPDHSTLPRGTVFHIFVRSPEDIQLRDFSGQAVKAYPVLSASTATRVQLIDASTGLWALASYSQWITSDAPGPRGLSIGDQFIFCSSTSGSSLPIMDILSEQKAIVCYATSGGCYAVVLSVSDTDITVGDAFRFADVTSYYDVAALSADKAVVCYRLNNSLYAAVLSISGMTITVGESVVVSGSVSGSVSLTALSADKALCGHISRTGDATYILPLTISGNTVANGANLKIGTGQAAVVTAISETTALANLAGKNSQAIKVSVSGNSITKEGSANLLSTAYEPSLTAISEGKALVAYKNANGLGCVRVVTLSGSDVYGGPELVPTTRRLQKPSVAALSEKSAVVCFLSADAPAYGLVYGLGIDRDNITVTGEKVFNFNPTSAVVARRLSPSRVLASFTSGTNYIGVAETLTLL